MPSRPAIAGHEALLNELRQWFGIEFHLVDGETGELLHCPVGHAQRDWSVRGELCRVVATKGKAAFIEEVEPLLFLAIPFCPDRSPSTVAVGTFVNAHSTNEPQLARAAETLGMEGQECLLWIRRQTCWSADSLERMGQMAAQRWASSRRVESLEAEVRSLSLHLATNYEEISLLYQLTHNLKLSSKADELAALAIQWLADVLPVESFVVKFTQQPGTRKADSSQEPMLVRCGCCPLDSEEISQIIESFAIQPGQQPLIVNRSTTASPDWRWPQVRELIVVPLVEGANCFGWLAGFNHSSGGEFGTVEASLLSSVAAILGIHSGNSELYRQQREFFAGVVRALTSAIDAKDPYTCGHSDRVARVARCGWPKSWAAIASKSTRSTCRACCTTSARSASTTTCCASRAS